jgi:hypothetical protein
MVVVPFLAFWIILSFNLVFGQQQNVLTYKLDYDFNHTNFKPSELYIKIPNFINRKHVSSDLLTELSFCGRVKFQVLLQQHLFTMGSLVRLLFNDLRKGLGFITLGEGQSYMFVIKDRILPQIWYSLCFAFSKNELLVVFNGHLLHTDLINLPSLNLTTAVLNSEV